MVTPLPGFPRRGRPRFPLKVRGGRGTAGTSPEAPSSAAREHRGAPVLGGAVEPGIPRTEPIPGTCLDVVQLPRHHSHVSTTCTNFYTERETSMTLRNNPDPTFEPRVAWSSWTFELSVIA